MNLKRLFSTDAVKGTKEYINSQRKYEIIRTSIYFCLSLALFAAGYITTGSRNNLLTIVAVLGCLPASKSLVETIMYCKYKSLRNEHADLIEKHSKGLNCLYDLIFTTREKTYPVLHMTIRNQNVIGYAESGILSEKNCEDHLKTSLKIDHHTDLSVKIFLDINKYTNRMEQLKNITHDSNKDIG
ncbi:MAG TPA: hypothetical protein VJY54_09420, partial [Lachnospiraceae bacterium]|nr:hypothetical protein [Lachnospiraceae bacterium]